jgi:hypothetical protein
MANNSYPSRTRALTLTIALAWSALAAAQSGKAAKINDLTGTWLTTNSASGPGAPPGPFLALNTFTKDGNIIAPNQGESACCPLNTPAQGRWKKIGARTFAITFIAINYNPDASLAGLLKVRQTITLNGSSTEFNATGIVDVTDPGGNPLATFQVATHGLRIEVEPLP